MPRLRGTHIPHIEPVARRLRARYCSAVLGCLADNTKPPSIFWLRLARAAYDELKHRGALNPETE